MELLERKPYISVIVPVYNGEQYICSCLDMLLQQTFEDYEIIIVDNGSNDNTFSIAKDYEKQYPNRISVYTIEHTDSPASGRNFGIKNSQAKYIAFCDVDDMMANTALKNYYDLLQDNDYDIIYSAFVKVSSNGKKLIVPEHFQDIGEILLNADVAFWNKLIKRSMFLATGDIPENTIFDDMAYIPVLLKNCKKIGYLDLPTYYHEVLDESESRLLDSPRLAHMERSVEFALNGCDLRYVDQLMARFLKWFISSIDARWQFADIYIKNIHNYYTYFVNNKYVKKDKKLYDSLMFYLSISTDYIPQIIYLNFTTRKYSDAEIQSLENTSFLNGAQIKKITLDIVSKSDDIVICRLLSNKLIVEAVEYYILKEIYINGGIYFGPELRKDAWLGSLLYFKAFFTREDRETISSRFYGAKPKNPIIRDILRTYSMSSWSDNISLKERMTCILVGKYRFSLNYNTVLFLYDAALLAPEATMFNISDKLYDRLQRRYSHIEYKDISSLCTDNYYIIKKDTFYDYFQRYAMQLKKRQKQNDSAKEELQSIKSSNSWRLLQYFKERKYIGIGRIVYKLYLWLYPKILK